ncbi:MAG: hypothetical protein RL105_813 [Verrucomicrobiota bacterium]|jgi:polar amino acid transport system substrate-binding protein
MTRRLLPVLLAAFATLTAAAQERALRWGAASDGNVPFAFHPDESDVLTGFEKEIVDELARRMGRRPVHVRNDWDGLIPGLQTGAYDVAVNGIEISDDRARSVDFSLPYFRGYEQIVVRRGATGMRTLAELAGRRVGTLGQTLALELLERTPGVTAVKYDQELQAYADLAAGRLDAVLLDFPIAKYYAGPDPRLELVGEPVGEFRYGVALPKGSPLKREVDAAVAGMAADGTLRRILSRWDLWGPAQASLHNQPAAPDGPPSGYRPQHKGQAPGSDAGNPHREESAETRARLHAQLFRVPMFKTEPNTSHENTPCSAPSPRHWNHAPRRRGSQTALCRRCRRFRQRRSRSS